MQIMGAYPSSYLSVGEPVDRALTTLAMRSGLSPALTVRLREVAAGLTNSEVAAAHGISINTVKTQVAQLLGALHVSCRHEIQDAVAAACHRAKRGATTPEILAFLILRLE